MRMMSGYSRLILLYCPHIVSVSLATRHSAPYAHSCSRSCSYSKAIEHEHEHEHEEETALSRYLAHEAPGVRGERLHGQRLPHHLRTTEEVNGPIGPGEARELVGQ